MKRKIIATFKDICNGERGANPRTLEGVIVLAIEIAREMREGRIISTLFVVVDSERTIAAVARLQLAPLPTI